MPGLDLAKFVVSFYHEDRVTPEAQAAYDSARSDREERVARAKTAWIERRRDLRDAWLASVNAERSEWARRRAAHEAKPPLDANKKPVPFSEPPPEPNPPDWNEIVPPPAPEPETAPPRPMSVRVLDAIADPSIENGPRVTHVAFDSLGYSAAEQMTITNLLAELATRVLARSK